MTPGAGPPSSLGGGDIVITHPQLNGRYTFDRFVMGPSNRRAFAVCQAVARAPGKTHNPLLIYGRTGVGKTHLLQAIGHAALEHDPTRRVAYLSSEAFTSELVLATQERRIPELRRRYRQLHLLLIDDIDLLGEKEQTQEEWYETFGALEVAQVQIVLTSARPPGEILSLTDRLVLSFERGHVAGLRRPDLRTRQAILRKKAQEEQLLLRRDVLRVIAGGPRPDVRELEGAMKTVRAFASFTGREITPELAREALRGTGALASNPEPHTAGAGSAPPTRKACRAKARDLRVK